MSSLLPCPFCGGEANTQIFDKVLNVGCPHCDIRTRFVLHDELDAAVNAWNMRHVETCRLPETRIDHGSIEYNGTTSWRLCSACGAEVLADPANYCPNCGRKVEG